MSKIYLSYLLDENTPTYSNRNIFKIEKKASIIKGDVANDSFIQTTVHIGTHIDMPYHFYDNGQTIENFDCKDFNFKNILFLEIKSKELIIKDELIEKLEQIKNKKDFDLLLVKTGICHKRDEEVFWKENYGFHPSIADYLREKFSNVRVFGFDSISVSSFAHRMIGREAHKAFLNPIKPILLLEDMDLRDVNEQKTINEVFIAPIRIKKCDGLPCTVIADIER